MEREAAGGKKSISRVIPKERKKVISMRAKGITAALSSALFLGMTPIFGKQSILFGMPPLAVVAIRTFAAALLLFILLGLLKRQYLYIYPAGLLGCLLAGWINGFGSLFYYSALGRIGAGIGQLLYSLYPIFVALWLFLDKQPPTKLTIFRMFIAVPAVYLLTRGDMGSADIIGVIEMLIASALYALHIPINQRILYDMPAPTVTFYTLLSMSAIVVPVFLFSDLANVPLDTQAWMPLIGLTLVTFLSRLTLFMGVKHLGGMQTALLGLGELIVTLIFSQLWLKEYLTLTQWIGAVILVISLLLIGFEKSPPRRKPGGWLSWLSHPTLPVDLPWQPHD